LYTFIFADFSLFTVWQKTIAESRSHSSLETGSCIDTWGYALPLSLSLSLSVVYTHSYRHIYMHEHSYLHVGNIHMCVFVCVCVTTCWAFYLAHTNSPTHTCTYHTILYTYKHTYIYVSFLNNFIHSCFSLSLVLVATNACDCKPRRRHLPRTPKQHDVEWEQPSSLYLQ